MKKQNLQFLTLTMIGVLAYSCQSEDDFLDPQFNKKAEIENDFAFGEKIILGKN